jgi:hypothetical protein
MRKGREEEGKGTEDRLGWEGDGRKNTNNCIQVPTSIE